jgi:hypothetical protein
MDNLGENKYFQSNVLNKEDSLSKLKVEFFAPGTPMQNGVVERAFPSILGRVRAMMKQAGFDEKAKGLMWAACVRTATTIECSLTDSTGVSSRKKLLMVVQNGLLI